MRASANLTVVKEEGKSTFTDVLAALEASIATSKKRTHKPPPPPAAVEAPAKRSRKKAGA
jgi:hypothetical protein